MIDIIVVGTFDVLNIFNIDQWIAMQLAKDAGHPIKDPVFQIVGDTHR